MMLQSIIFCFSREKKIYSFLNFYLFMFGCAGSALLRGLFSSCRLLQWWSAGFSLWGPLLVQSTGTRASVLWQAGSAVWLPGSRAQAQQLWHTGFAPPLLWDPPRPGIRLLSLALAGGSFTTEPPGNPHMFLYHIQFLSSCPAQNFIVRQSTTISLPIKCVSSGLLSQSSGLLLNEWQFCFLEQICQCLETFLTFTSGGMLLASSGQRIGLLLNIPLIQTTLTIKNYLSPNINSAKACSRFTSLPPKLLHIRVLPNICYHITQITNFLVFTT